MIYFSWSKRLRVNVTRETRLLALVFSLPVRQQHLPKQPRHTGSANAMNKSEVIIELGAEGGSLALRGVRTQRGWHFN